MPGLIGRRVRQWHSTWYWTGQVRGRLYLCSGHPVWWLWSHVRECPLQPGSCAPGSPGRSRWWRTQWPCPAPPPTAPGGRTLSCKEGARVRVTEWVNEWEINSCFRLILARLDWLEWWPLPRHILMDAFKTSLRVVLAHIRQVKIKIVEGVGGRITLRNFNTLWGWRKKKNSCLWTKHDSIV